MFNNHSFCLEITLFFISLFLLTEDWPCPVGGETTPAVWTQGRLPPVGQRHVELGKPVSFRLIYCFSYLKFMRCGLISFHSLQYLLSHDLSELGERVLNDC